MNKSPEAFRTISEVAETLDVPPHVLRFWETRFIQVKPVKRGGGRRYYRPEDVCLLRGIRGLLYDDGLTIKGAQKVLRERGIRHVIDLGTPADGEEAAPRTKAPRATTRKAKPARPRKQAAAKPVPATPDVRDDIGDLFADTDTLVRTDTKTETAPNTTTGTNSALRRESLKELVAKLQDLRTRMADESI